MLDDLRVILEAEAEGRRQVDAAREQAAVLVRQAEDEAQQRLHAARAAREADAARVEARLVAGAQQEAKDIAVTSESAAAVIHSQAIARLERAVEAIVKAVVAWDAAASEQVTSGR